jgi:hypothetical protein
MQRGFWVLISNGFSHTNSRTCALEFLLMKTKIAPMNNIISQQKKDKATENKLYIAFDFD